jgi:hypothetical protein
MSERSVAIPVDSKVRDLIKEAKGQLTYNQYLSKIMVK